MAIGNEELMHECFPKHTRVGTARMKKDKETDEEGKKRDASMERSKASRKEKRSLADLNYPIQNTTIRNEIC